MVAGLKFLSKKSFNPQNLTNQKSVWEREQESKREAARMRERERQLTIERDHEELARSREGTSGCHKATLRFMYDAPPGLQTQSSCSNQITEQTESENHREMNHDQRKTGTVKCDPGDSNLFERKSGDDDAAAAFRRMLAGSVSSGSSGTLSHDPISEDSKVDGDLIGNRSSIVQGASSSLIISGSTAEAGTADKSHLTQLEKAVGKRIGSSALTYQEQIARFPQLKNAPVALKQRGGGGKNGGTNGDDNCVQTNLNFKPLGAQIRNVRCLACKIWGHSKGDRECKLSGWDPFSMSSSQPAVNSIADDTNNANSFKVNSCEPYKSSQPCDSSNHDNNNKYEYDHDDSSREYRKRKHKHHMKKRKHKRESRTSDSRKRKQSDRDHCSRKRLDSDSNSDRENEERVYSSDSESESYKRRRKEHRRERRHKRHKHRRSRSRSRSFDSFSKSTARRR